MEPLIGAPNGAAHWKTIAEIRMETLLWSPAVCRGTSHLTPTLGFYTGAPVRSFLEAYPGAQQDITTLALRTGALHSGAPNGISHWNRHWSPALEPTLGTPHWGPTLLTVEPHIVFSSTRRNLGSEHIIEKYKTSNMLKQRIVKNNRENTCFSHDTIQTIR